MIETFAMCTEYCTDGDIISGILAGMANVLGWLV
ncbi:hypothetical protein SAMN06265360_10329 [Haloechinothrix alba]|uniref:Uncharacterized protein n=1 Tax=Haloechinothrix alba TaxID=664784 RepID=A0A238VME4_9PSEU|nr:hypothetical protein SAMN06265360_10329 [Haloechinothrix alba]